MKAAEPNALPRKTTALEPQVDIIRDDYATRRPAPLLAARAVASSGAAIGIDTTAEMVARARGNAAAAALSNVEIRQGLIEELPLSDDSVDVVISNSVLNLSTRKSRVLAETLRVLRPGGRVVISDLVLTKALPEEVLKSPAALAGRLAGTLAGPVLLKKLFNVGFDDITVVERRSFGLSDIACSQLWSFRSSPQAHASGCSAATRCQIPLRSHGWDLSHRRLGRRFHRSRLRQCRAERQPEHLQGEERRAKTRPYKAA